MLGRLKIPLDACEEVFIEFSREIFSTVVLFSLSWLFWLSWLSRFFKGNRFLQANGRFDAKVLENVIKRTIKRESFPVDVSLKDKDSRCKVYVN